MAYEQKPGTGSIFKNEYKTVTKHPDYRGTIITPEGKSYDLSLWVKEAQNGKKYFSVACQEPYTKQAPAGDQPAPATTQPETDDLPF